MTAFLWWLLVWHELFRGRQSSASAPVTDLAQWRRDHPKSGRGAA